MNTNNQSSESNNIASYQQLEDDIDIAKILGHLYQNKFIILAVSLCTLLIAFFYTFTLQPQYSTSTMLQISVQSNAAGSILGSLGLKSTQNSPTESELALIRTRHILEPVIRENNLNVKASPRYFPIFGEWMARHHQGATLADPFFGLRAYAWGGEKIEIKYFFVPPEYEGKSFRLIAGKNNTYQVYSLEKELLTTGKVGKRSLFPKYPGFSLELLSLKAHPGTQFILTFLSPYKMVNQLSHQLKISKVASETDSGSDHDTSII